MMQSKITKKFIRCKINGCMHKFTSIKGIFNHCVLRHNIKISKIGQYRFIKEFNYSRIPWYWMTDISFKKFVLLRKTGWKCWHCGFNKRRPDGGIVLELDHIDGNHYNNSKENLRILCLNCHAMTPTFRNWGNRKSTRIRKRKTKEEMIIIRKSAGLKLRKFSCKKERLRNLVWWYGSNKVGRFFNVAHTTIRRRCGQMNIRVPPHGSLDFRKKRYYEIFGKELVFIKLE